MCPPSVTQLATAAGRSGHAGRAARFLGRHAALRRAPFSAASPPRPWPNASAAAPPWALLRSHGGSISLGFGYAFYLREHALRWFMVCLFALGVGGANFAIYTFWLPEQYRTGCRASAFAFATSFGRFAGRGRHVSGGRGRRALPYHRHPVALTSIAFLLGLGAASIRRRNQGAAAARLNLSTSSISR